MGNGFDVTFSYALFCPSAFNRYFQHDEGFSSSELFFISPLIKVSYIKLIQDMCFNTFFQDYFNCTGNTRKFTCCAHDANSNFSWWLKSSKSHVHPWPLRAKCYPPAHSFAFKTKLLTECRENLHCHQRIWTVSHSTQTSLYSLKQPAAATAAGAREKNFARAVVTDIRGGPRRTQLMEYKKEKRKVHSLTEMM